MEWDNTKGREHSKESTITFQRNHSKARTIPIAIASHSCTYGCHCSSWAIFYLAWRGMYSTFTSHDLGIKFEKIVIIVCYELALHYNHYVYL